MAILFITFLLTLPFIYTGMKLFKKTKSISKKLENLWSEFWWNTPLRTFTELYIEISFAFFLNSLNVSIIFDKFIDQILYLESSNCHISDDMSRE